MFNINDNNIFAKVSLRIEQSKLVFEVNDTYNISKETIYSLFYDYFDINDVDLLIKPETIYHIKQKIKNIYDRFLINIEIEII